MNASLIESFASLDATGLCRHAFLGKVPGVDVAADRETALARLAGAHHAAREALGMGAMPFVTAEQVHGAEVAVVDETTVGPVPGVDALVTNRPGVCLGIYVADCGAIYALDPVRKVIGLAHSGRKGTELQIVPAMLRAMQRAFGCNPAEMVVQLGPCIRPPHYEVDFAAEILRQCREMGLVSVHDCGACTAATPDRYYSYRMEKGKTGRMLALLALT
jgi:hypothetical protein